jgi:hypothetical protein
MIAKMMGGGKGGLRGLPIGLLILTAFDHDPMCRARRVVYMRKIAAPE